MKPEQLASLRPDSTERQEAAAVAAGKANAWRRAMEQEHARIAATSRSVQAADLSPAATASAAGQPAASTTVAPAAARLTSTASVTAGSRPGQLQASASSQPNPSGYLGPARQAPGHAATGLGVWPTASRNQATIAARAPTHASNTGTQLSTPSAPAAALLESQYRQHWSLKNVHMAHTAHGVRLWIRDPDLAPGPQCERLAGQLASTLKADGQQLVGLTINGNIIL